MRKYFGVIAALLLLVAPAYAQDVQRVPLAIAWDMNGEAADADQVVTAAAIVDSKSDYTITAQPDTCRVLNLTIVDTNMSAGTITVTGTDCYGDAQTCTWAATAGDDTGVVALTYGTGNGTTCAFASVTSLSNGVMTGESDETVALGYGAINSALTYPIYGIRKEVNGVRWIDPFATEGGREQILLNGTAATSAVTADGGAFQNLVAGDLVYITYNGRTFERLLTVVTDDDTATLSAAIPTAIAPGTTTAVGFRYKKFYKLVEPNDSWIPVRGRESFFSVVEIDGCSATGGCTTSVECTTEDPFADAYGSNIQVDTDNVADTATGEPTTSVDLRLAPYQYCRVGVKFGTGDTSGAENIDIFAAINRRN